MIVKNTRFFFDLESNHKRLFFFSKFNMSQHKYIQPEGLSNLTKDLTGLASFDPEESELVLFKVPSDLPIQTLNNMILPRKSKKGKLECKIKSNLKQQVTVSYHVDEINKDSVEVGEVTDFTIIAPKGNHFKGGMHISKIFQLTPDEEITTHDDLVKAGESLKSIPYVPRTQPEGMQLQSLPIGFHTSGDALTKSLKRYGKFESTAKPVINESKTRKSKGAKKVAKKSNK
ncbi:hypothetical protein BC833DRAFT_94353 [Globomyces pollinis-pini]|nr:hypothetical protein BC833DRAFT_94353 [Globomyces pollinis-pini]